MERTAKTNAAKSNGVHYTPVELARFLAESLISQLPSTRRAIKVLDPACGDGALLEAFVQALPATAREHCTLVGYETDPQAARRARKRLGVLDTKTVDIRVGDFLSQPEARGRCSGEFDALITNPPYVRTQVMGSAKAQTLARDFQLTGRVDLYHAFIRASANALKPRGVLGLLTSNRFLTIRSGEASRKLLLSHFQLKNIFDLGDTKLFKAAVLPVIVVAERKETADVEPVELNCSFNRVYRHRQTVETIPDAQERFSLLEALRKQEVRGLIHAAEGLFEIERGNLAASGAESLWSLSTPEYEEWLKQVQRHQTSTFDDVAHVRVGIKTTADEVFLNDDWESLPDDMQPESDLIRPLIRHFDAKRWIADRFVQSVVYPHEDLAGKRSPIDLNGYPRARRYFESHRARLHDRKYLIESGRKWYEIWVPHSPNVWAQPKIVYPDISDAPRFFLDHSGAVVNGDCYWMTLRRGVEPNMLLLMLAVANSSFTTKYYDIAFHNKLYSGRRRYMTQYVKKFPLPDAKSKSGSAIIRRTAALLNDGRISESEEEIDQLVWEAYGLRRPDGRQLPR